MPADPGVPPDADEWWQTWTRRLDEGEDPTDFVQAFPDDALVVLLQTAGSDRATERNLILAETLRRLSGRPSDRSMLAAEFLDDIVHDASVRTDATAQVVHETEAAVESKGSAMLEDGSSDPAHVAHQASHEVEALRDLAHEVERKADYLMRLHRTGELVTPGRAGEEQQEDGADE